MKVIPIRKIKSPKKDSNSSESFGIRSVRDVQDGNDMVQELHRHDFFFVLALKNGNGKHVIDFQPYVIKDYSIFFMRPGQVHELELKAGSEGYLMEFNTDFYRPHDKASNQLLRTASNKNLCQLDENKLKKLFSLLSYIFQEFNAKEEGYQEVIKANLGIFFIELVRYRQHKNETATNVNSYTQDRFEKLLELLESFISTRKQVSEYAEMLNLSTYQLNAITKTSVNKTCSELINEQIILEAKRYLLATTNQVNQIADLLGFEDVSYFIRFFKKHTRYTPEAFRHNLG